jgi:hypothetical protein
MFRVGVGELAQQLEPLGCLTEWSSQILSAVDPVDREHAQAVADFLAEREQEDQLLYETGCS